MRKHQSGFLSWNVMLSLGAAGFIILCLVKTVPAYVDHMYVEDALKVLAQDNSDLESMGKSQITKKLNKYLTINSVGKPQSTSFVFHNRKDGFLVSSIYEVRVPVMLNIDVVMSFKSQLNTSETDKCCDYLVDVESKTNTDR